MNSIKGPRGLFYKVYSGIWVCDCNPYPLRWKTWAYQTTKLLCHPTNWGRFENTTILTKKNKEHYYLTVMGKFKEKKTTKITARFWPFLKESLEFYFFYLGGMLLLPEGKHFLFSRNCSFVFFNITIYWYYNILPNWYWHELQNSPSNIH